MLRGNGEFPRSTIYFPRLIKESETWTSPGTTLLALIVCEELNTSSLSYLVPSYTSSLSTVARSQSYCLMIMMMKKINQR